jgi:virulence factor Mce-like protein
MTNSAARFAGLSKVLTAFVVLALLAAVFLLFTNGGREKTIVADFKVANSLYKGNEVRVLGVPVGRVTKIEPRGDRVRVTLEYDSAVRLPADAKAVVVSPSIVGDRFVQLGPAYSGGAALPDNARIGLDRTAVPVELDDIFKSIDNLAIALGPEGANKDGSLSRLVNSTAEQLDGQGEQLAETLENFSKLSTTLDNNDEELFSSVREIDEFVSLLRRNDENVRDFFDSTARVSKVLAKERDELADTIKALTKALIEVRDFVRENRTAIRGNVQNLESLAALLANRSAEIDHVLAEAPSALVNLGAAGGGDTGTLEARADLAELLGHVDLAGLLGNLSEADILAILSLLPADLLGGGGLPLSSPSSATQESGAGSTEQLANAIIEGATSPLAGMLGLS